MIEITYDKVVHTSDHFDKIQAYTEQLIKQGDMYMDDTDGETVSLLGPLSISSRSMLHLGQGTTASRNTRQEPRNHDRAELGTIQGLDCGV